MLNTSLILSFYVTRYIHQMKYFIEIHNFYEETSIPWKERLIQLMLQACDIYVCVSVCLILFLSNQVTQSRSVRFQPQNITVGFFFFQDTRHNTPRKRELPVSVVTSLDKQSRLNSKRLCYIKQQRRRPADTCLARTIRAAAISTPRLDKMPGMFFSANPKDLKGTDQSLLDDKTQKRRPKTL